MANKIQSVRINCSGDREIHNRPHYEAVEISLTDSIFPSSYETSDIAALIGIPLFTRRCPQDPAWKAKKDRNVFRGPLYNRDATFLHRCLDTDGELDLAARSSVDWGMAPTRWQYNPGSIIVMRQDKKPLLPLHVEALCNYCFYEVWPLVAHSLGEYEPEEPMDKAAVMQMICRPTFVIYWSKFLDAKLMEEGVDDDVVSPYEV
ncbi:hypothetical protein ABW21_db0206018 [Orbilia brochopaga]|nr:hypothetical protein ABW21_db0206018 [Drechslerella brochopaga]